MNFTFVLYFLKSMNIPPPQNIPYLPYLLTPFLSCINAVHFFLCSIDVLFACFPSSPSGARACVVAFHFRVFFRSPARRRVTRYGLHPRYVGSSDRALARSASPISTTSLTRSASSSSSSFSSQSNSSDSIFSDCSSLCNGVFLEH